MHPCVRRSLRALFVSVVMAMTGCAHTQQPVRQVYVISKDAAGIGSRVEGGMGGAGADAYCNELQKQCYTQCWRRKPEISIKKGSGDHRKYCTSQCLKVFMDCTQEQEELERQESQAPKKELHFTNMDKALGWLREHKTEVALGTIVIVGGVVAAPYALVVLGGALVLAPL